MHRLRPDKSDRGHPMQRTGIGPEEFAARRERLLDHAGTTVVLFDQAYIQY